MSKILVIDCGYNRLAVPLEHLAVVAAAETVDLVYPNGYSQPSALRRTGKALSFEIVDAASILDPEPLQPTTTGATAPAAPAAADPVLLPDAAVPIATEPAIVFSPPDTRDFVDAWRDGEPL
jgi:hypothetical protein